jgi:hypothetical protein
MADHPPDGVTYHGGSGLPGGKPIEEALGLRIQTNTRGHVSISL